MKCDTTQNLEKASQGQGDVPKQSVLQRMPNLLHSKKPFVYACENRQKRREMPICKRVNGKRCEFRVNFITTGIYENGSPKVNVSHSFMRYAPLRAMPRVKRITRLMRKLERQGLGDSLRYRMLQWLGLLEISTLKISFQEYLNREN